MVRGRSHVVGVLLVGGSSRRFGSPKALARVEDETLAERGYRVLEEAFERVIAVGKAKDALPLPFAVLDDGSDERAAIVGLAAALRLANAEICVVLPTDMPFVTAELLRSLAAALDEKDTSNTVLLSRFDAAVVPSGPLPGAYRTTALPVLERRIAAGELRFQDVLKELRTRVVDADAKLLRNINTPDDLRRTR